MILGHVINLDIEAVSFGNSIIKGTLGNARVTLSVDHDANPSVFSGIIGRTRINTDLETGLFRGYELNGEASEMEDPQMILLIAMGGLRNISYSCGDDCTRPALKFNVLEAAEGIEPLFSE